MSKKKCLSTGQKIYDTPRPYTDYGDLSGYNSCYENSFPTQSVGSYCHFTKYWERQLFRECLTILDFTVPDHWDKDYFLWVLFRAGYVVLIDDPDNGGIIPQFAQLSKRDVYYAPTRATVSNPLIQRKRYTLGENAALIKLTPDYEGIWDIVHYYAETLGLMSQSLRMAIVNTRITDVNVTNNKALAETMKQVNMLTDEGKPTFAIHAPYQNSANKADNKPWAEFHTDVGRNYLVDKYQDVISDCLDEFRRRIGIPVVAEKKERRISSEVAATVAPALTAADVWYDCITRSFEGAFRVFPSLRGKLKVEKNQIEGAADVL